MSIQNVPHTAGHSIILDPASFTLAQAPSRLPADTYDLVVSLPFIKEILMSFKIKLSV